MSDMNRSESRLMRVQLFRSLNGRLRSHQACVKGLGLRRMHQIAEIEDSPATRGMLRAVAYMVREIKEDSNAA